MRVTVAGERRNVQVIDEITKSSAHYSSSLPRGAK